MYSKARARVKFSEKSTNVDEIRRKFDESSRKVGEKSAKVDEITRKVDEKMDTPGSPTKQRCKNNVCGNTPN
jgi:dsDNA-specific endonuclease/ATPase MutS2